MFRDIVQNHNLYIPPYTVSSSVLATDPNTQRQPSWSMATYLRSKDGSLRRIGYAPRADGGYSLGETDVVKGSAKDRSLGNKTSVPRIAAAVASERNQTTPTVLVPPSPAPQVTPVKYIPQPYVDYTPAQSYSPAPPAPKTGSLRQAITSVDRFLGGFLPGGPTPTQVRTDRLLRNTKDQAALNAARLAAQTQENDYKAQKIANDVKAANEQQISKESLDQVKQSWYEQFGLFQSDQEESIRRLQEQQAYFQNQAQQIASTNAAFLQAADVAGGVGQLTAFNQALNQEQPGFFDKLGDSVAKGTSIAIPVILGIVAIGLLSKSKR